jgi:predicted  nucleic acid-binding Zn-ribbon protein
MENWNNFVREQEEDEPESFESDDGKEMSFSDEEVKDFDDKESRAEKFIAKTGLKDGMQAVQRLGYGTPQFFDSLMKHFQEIQMIQDRLKEAASDVQKRPKRFPRNTQQLMGALKEALANTAKLESLIRKITSAPDKNPFASANAASAYKGENPGGTGQTAQDALGFGERGAPELDEQADPIKAKNKILKKIKDEIAAVEKEIKSLKKPAAKIPTPIGMASSKIKLKRLQAKLKKLKEKLKKKEADLAGPGGNADQKKKSKIKEQASSATLRNTKPTFKMEGNMVIATIKHNGKEYIGKAKIRAGNIGMARTSAATRARRELAKAIAQEPAAK